MAATDFAHLDAIDHRLARAKANVGTAKGRNAAQRNDWFAHEVRMIERERANEVEFLGRDRPVMSLDDILDGLDDLLAA